MNNIGSSAKDVAIHMGVGMILGGIVGLKVGSVAVGVIGFGPPLAASVVIGKIAAEVFSDVKWFVNPVVSLISARYLLSLTVTALRTGFPLIPFYGTMLSVTFVAGTIILAMIKN